MKFLGFALVILLLAGCRKTSPIVGEWTTTDTVLGTQAESRLNFADNGSYTDTTLMQGQKGNALTAVDTGTWKLEGDRLTVHVDDVQWKFSGSGPAVARAKERFAANKAKIIEQANAEPTDTIKWDGADSYSLVDSKGITHTFKRIK